MMHNPRNCFSLLQAVFYIFCLLGLSIQPLYAFQCPLEYLPSDVPVALVIANSKYETRKLEQSVHDAKAMEKVLKELGFRVIFRTELNKQAMNKAITEFSQCLKKIRGVGLFYFTGYGVQINEQNYLRPLNANIRDEIDVTFEAFPVKKLLTRLQTSQNELNIIILDACRHDPYFPLRSRGLASISTQNGFFVAYPAETDQICQEELGMTNSLYIRELTKGLKKAKQNHTRIEDVFMQVNEAVEQKSHGQQVPIYIDSKIKKFCFGGCQEKLPPLTVELNVRSNVKGAMVTIDGTPSGNTPLNDVELRKGWHIVKIKKEGYVPYEQSINLQGDQSLFARLEKKVKLIINCSVNGAKVIIKNTKTKVGSSGSIRNKKLIIKLQAGEYFVRVEKEGYVPFKKSFYLQSEQELDAKLIKKVKLIVRSNAEGAEVTIKGNKDNGFGFILEGKMNKLLPVGTYTVRVEKSGYVSSELTINLQKERQIVIYLAKKYLAKKF